MDRVYIQVLRFLPEVICGNSTLEKIHRIYVSHKLALATEDPLPGYPLLAGKAANSEILIYLCKNYACRQPVKTIQEFVNLLHRK